MVVDERVPTVVTWLTESMASVVPFTPLGRVTLSVSFSPGRGMKRNTHDGAFTSSGNTGGKPSNATFHCGLTTKLQTSLRAASAGSETSSVSARARPGMPLRLRFARAESHERGFVVAHLHAGGEHRFARDQRNLDRQRGALRRDARDDRCRTVQSRSRLNTRSTRTKAGNSAPASSAGAAASGVALARQLERAGDQAAFVDAARGPAARAHVDDARRLREGELHGFGGREPARETHGVRARR